MAAVSGGLSLSCSFSEVKDDVQRYLSQVEHSKLLEKNDKKELYLLFVNCLEDSMCEKLEDSVGCGHGNSLPEDRGFPENYLPASSSGAPQEASVEYLQAVAEVRLCLSRAAELIFDLQQHKEPEQMKEKHRYLKNVEKFCSLARNDWHCVYLVRRIASQHGMEFAQKLVTEPQFSWVFPAEILQQVDKRHLLVMVLVLCLHFVLLRGFPTVVCPLALGQSGSGWEVACPGCRVNGVSPGSTMSAADALGSLKCPSAWEEEEIMPPPAG
ncbi:E3 ubiquitin-protein ligase RNF213-like, partial [Passer montanus]|uniref:E3 ubiquitin-protein ligase RNF213-like n=1 Tax=Passer montanus TaxID=9160 RepID=UPI00195F66B8